MAGASRSPLAEQPTQLSALIVGGGVSGIAAACRLQMDLGVHDFLICERSAGLGGTWYNNRYPGVGCDVPTRLYSLSFAQRVNWKHFFSLGPDIRDYLQDVARQFNLLGRTRLNTQVLSATWIPSRTHWHIRTRDEAGVEREHTARILVCGTGALSIPREPDTPGWQSFKGPLFHSAEWRADVDCTDKDVVVIGNGCSATQIIPVLAPKVKSLTQIVRTRHWIVPQLASPFDNAVCRWMERHIPGFVPFERGLLVVALESMFVQALKKDGGPARARFARLCHKYITQCAPPEYHELLLPNEAEIPVACKRRVFDAGYIPALGRSNVELCGDQAKQIVEDGVILESGRKLKADVIITANGFKTDGAMLMDITNGDGVTLAEHWKRSAGVPEAYRGTLVNSFPNMFLLFGPNTVTGHFSAIWSIERSVELMTSLLRPVFLRPSKSADAKCCDGPLQRSAGRAVQVRQEAEAVEQVFIQESMKDLVFSAGCGAWYADPATGKVTAISPSLQTTYLVRTRFPVFSDVRYTGLSSLQAWFSWRLSQRLGSLLRLGAVPDLRSDAAARRGFLLRLIRRILWPARFFADVAFGKSLRGASWAIDHVLTWRMPPSYEQAQKLRAAGKYREIGTA